MIGPAHRVIIGVGGVERAALVVTRQGRVVCLWTAGDAVEHIDEFTELCSGLSTEDIRRLRVYIAVAIHIEDAGLVEDALDVRKHHRIRQAAAAGFLVEDVGIVIAVDDVARELELVVHILPVGLQQLIGDDDALVCGDDRLRVGVVAEGFRQEGAVRQNGGMDAA